MRLLQRSLIIGRRGLCVFGLQILIELETALLDDEPHWYKLQTHDVSSLPLPHPSPYLPRRQLHGGSPTRRLQSKFANFIMLAGNVSIMIVYPTELENSIIGADRHLLVFSWLLLMIFLIIQNSNIKHVYIIHIHNIKIILAAYYITSSKHKFWGISIQTFKCGNES